MRRVWYVYAFPRDGGNKTVDGPFTTVMEAASYVAKFRGIVKWCRVAIYGKMEKERAS